MCRMSALREANALVGLYGPKVHQRDIVIGLQMPKAQLTRCRGHGIAGSVQRDEMTFCESSS